MIKKIKKYFWKDKNELKIKFYSINLNKKRYYLVSTDNIDILKLKIKRSDIQDITKYNDLIIVSIINSLQHINIKSINGFLIFDPVMQRIIIKEDHQILFANYLEQHIEDGVLKAFNVDYATHLINELIQDEQLTVKELAALHNINISTARRWCATGKLPAFQNHGDWRIWKSNALLHAPSGSQH